MVILMGLSDIDKQLVQEVKCLFMINCVDGAFVSIKKAARFLKSKKATKHYLEVLKGYDCLISYDEAIYLAIDELKAEGLVVTRGKEIRRKFSFEK